MTVSDLQQRSWQQQWKARTPPGMFSLVSNDNQPCCEMSKNRYFRACILNQHCCKCDFALSTLSLKMSTSYDSVGAVFHCSTSSLETPLISALPWQAFVTRLGCEQVLATAFLDGSTSTVGWNYTVQYWPDWTSMQDSGAAT